MRGASSQALALSIFTDSYAKEYCAFQEREEWQ